MHASMNISVGAMGDARDTTILEDSARTRFRSGDYVEAISIYTKLLEKQSQDKSLDSSRQLLRSKWLSNRALARYKIGDLDSCSIDCLEAIENDPHNLKAHFRLIQVHQDQNNFEAALDILRSLKYSKVLQSAHSNWSVLVRTKENEVKKCKESNKPNALTLEESSAMVSQHHTLRLCIKKSPPLHCTVGKPFQVEVYLSNEFGLFSKELLPRTGDSVLQADQRVVVQVLDTTSYQVSAVVSCVAVMEKPRNELAQETTSNAHLVKYRKCPMWIWFNVSDKCQFQAHNCALHISIEGCYKINPVLTRPVVVYQKNVFETQHNIDGPEYNGYGTNYRVLEMNDSIKVCLVERPEDYGIPGKVWDGSYVLLDYLQNKVDWKTLSDNITSDDGLHVLELGAGTGVLGIALAKLEIDEIASITITDLPSVVALIQENIDLNFSLGAQQRQKLCSAAYTWGEPIDGISKNFQNSQLPNVIVMSDVVYSPEFYQPLFDSLVLLCNNNTIVYWAHRHRNPNDYQFFIKLCTKFNLLTVCGSLPRLEIDEQSGQENGTLLRELDNCRRSFVAECDTDDGVETRGDVSIHRLQLK